jgi:hypothetical protein
MVPALTCQGCDVLLTASTLCTERSLLAVPRWVCRQCCDCPEHRAEAEQDIDGTVIWPLPRRDPEPPPA